MSKPLREYIFRPVDGIWTEISGTGHTLAEVLSQYQIIVDDRCNFARLYDYDQRIIFLYHASAGKATLTLLKME